MLLSIGMHAQIQQNINKPSGTVSNPIFVIDSIQFNAAGDEMQVVFLDSTLVTHPIFEIESVTFSAISLENSSEHSCGVADVHNEELIYGIMVDQEGNLYKTIVIGDQEWMAENLKTGKYRNGEEIPTNLNDIEWENTLQTEQGAWAWFADDSLNECPFGKLYNWFAATDVRNVCPVGWHVPSTEEWISLANSLGGEDVAGGKMKSIGFNYWQSPNELATNECGFSGLPSGDRDIDGSYNNQNFQGIFWSTTESDAEYAIAKRLLYNFSLLFTDDNGYKQAGFSIRCIRD
jgi:uncharacterized protein (TIGR02145 family)